MIINSYEIQRFKAQFKEHAKIVWQMDDASLACALGWADALGKREELVEKIKQACFPTFFGQDAITYLSMDDEASLYFVIYLQKHINGLATDNPRPVEGARFAMNGGIIFHPGWRPCPNNTSGADATAPEGTKCGICGREEGHTEIRDNTKGSWSIHT